MLAESFFSQANLGSFGFRWLHILVGIMWIGLLYYFNFVQVPAFAAFGDEARARNIAIDKVARKALWWFRWAAVLAGGEADPNAAAAGRKAVMASRQNAIFSVSMLFFMVYKSHKVQDTTNLVSSSDMMTYWIISLVVIAILELNALGLMPWKTQANKGLNVLYDGKGVRNPIIAAFGLWVVFLVLSEIFLAV